MLIYFLYAYLTGHFQFVIISTGSILLHEAAHAMLSVLCGHPPKCIELTPLGAVMRLEDDGKIPPLRRAGVIIAGPAASLLLCWASIHGTLTGMLGEEIGRMLFMSNLSILLLNLLPVMPLDGGRLLAIILELLFPQRIVNRIIRILGYLVGAGLIILNLWCTLRLGGWNLSLAFAGCCLIYSAAVSSTTRMMSELRQYMDRKIQLERQGSRKTICITCLSNEFLARLVRKLPNGRSAVYLCLEAGSLQPLGWLDEYRLVQQYLQTPSGCVRDCFALNHDSIRL